ncbi:MAG TPA: hypothetical protein IGS40_20380 [Trichormus sp. M33_DOE_039]|nr:hypothetical protein [Trichormus sp. M33_DOE_039]
MKQVILICSIFAAQIMFTPAFAIPSGSYIRSCKNIREIKPVRRGSPLAYILIANCRNRNGKLVSTQLTGYTACKPGTINNDDGRLVCQK